METRQRQVGPEKWQEIRSLKSQNATLKRGQYRNYPPYAFTEHAALMAANILKSKTAVSVSIYAVRKGGQSYILQKKTWVQPLTCDTCCTYWTG
jgi:hypothetical protein